MCIFHKGDSVARFVQQNNNCSQGLQGQGLLLSYLLAPGPIRFYLYTLLTITKGDTDGGGRSHLYYSMLLAYNKGDAALHSLTLMKVWYPTFTFTLDLICLPSV